MTDQNKCAQPADESTSELICRLRHADSGSIQRASGSRIFGEAADCIEQLEDRLGETLHDLFERERQLRDASHLIADARAKIDLCRDMIGLWQKSEKDGLVLDWRLGIQQLKKILK